MIKLIFGVQRYGILRRKAKKVTEKCLNHDYHKIKKIIKIAKKINEILKILIKSRFRRFTILSQFVSAYPHPYPAKSHSPAKFGFFENKSVR